jgi:hypothetical protein
MMDFGGVAGTEFKAAAIPCWLEMQTLGCKLLEAERDSWFVTSDHPVVMMNQLFAALEPHRSFAGFSRSGFQLLLPISPQLCLFFYDPKVYKVGTRGSHLIGINRSDVELVNSLQVQSSEECIYCHTPRLRGEVRRLITDYARWRTSVRDSLRELPGRNANETVLHLRQASPKLARPWSFCRFRKRRNIGEDNRRDPSWSAFVTAVTRDMDEHPGRGVFESMEKILGHRFTEQNVDG